MKTNHFIKVAKIKALRIYYSEWEQSWDFVGSLSCTQFLEIVLATLFTKRVKKNSNFQVLTVVWLTLFPEMRSDKNVDYVRESESLDAKETMFH